jgi:uncharacterized protein (TIGR03437 family)
VRAAGILFLIAGVCCAQVQNGADTAAGVSTTMLAPGSQAAVSYFPTSSTPASSAAVSFLPVNTTTPFPAQIISVSPASITFIVPPNVPYGPAQLIYKPGSQATQWTRVTIVPTSFSLYRTGPVGPLIAPIVPLTGPAYPSGLAKPAQPGFGVEIFGSGLGAVPPSRIQVTLGGVAQQVLYAGTPVGLPGLTQIDFLVAPGTPDGCYVPLVVSYGTQSVSSFLSKTSDGMPCHHPWGLSAQALTMLDSGEAISVGEIQLNTGIVAAASNRASRQESAQIIPAVLNAGQIASSFVGIAGNPAQPCSVASATGSGFGGGFSSAGTGQLTNSAGTITLPYTSPQATDSPLSGLPPPVIAPGPWQFTATAESVLPAGASFSFTLPPPIQLSGGAPIAINRTESSTVTWNGSAYDSFATLQLTLTSFLSPVISCSVPAQSGRVTIPASLLASFRPGSAGALSVTVSENGAGIPSADFTLNGAPVLALALWTSTDTRPVDFQ